MKYILYYLYFIKNLIECHKSMLRNHFMAGIAFKAAVTSIKLAFTLSYNLTKKIILTIVNIFKKK